MKKKLKKLTSFVLAFGMICSLTPSSVWAEGTASPTDSSIVETSEESTEETTETTTEITTEATTEGVTEETTEAPDASKENEDAESTEDSMYIVFDHNYSDADLSAISTTDLFVETSDASVFTKNTNVVSNYDNAYVLSFDSVEEARFAYSYYVDKVDFITDMSNVVSLAENTDDKEEENLDSEELKEDEEDSANSEEDKKGITNETEAVEQVEEDKADLSDVNKNSDDAIANMNDINTKSYKGYIALIDSGCTEADAKLSVLGDDGSDSVGHGSRMYEYIKEENPNAKVLSIKAFDGNKTDIASVYAGIKLAIESDVDVINLSFVAIYNEYNSILADVIQEALDKGIVVIGAAGNYKASAKRFIPGGISGVTSVGAVNEDGTLFDTSNYDADLYVVATSTSEATARYSGIFTSGNESDKVYKDLVTTTDDEKEEDIDCDDKGAILQSGYNQDAADMWWQGHDNTTFPHTMNAWVDISGYNGSATPIDSLTVSAEAPDAWDTLCPGWQQAATWYISTATLKSYLSDAVEFGALYKGDHSSVRFSDRSQATNTYLWWGCIDAGWAYPTIPNGHARAQLGWVKLADEERTIDGKVYEYAYYGTVWDTDGGTQSIGLIRGFYKLKRWYKQYKVLKVGTDNEAVKGCSIDVYDSTGTVRVGAMTDNGNGTYTWESSWMTSESDAYSEITLWEVKGGTGVTTGRSYDNPMNNGKWIQSSGKVGTTMTKFTTHKWTEADVIRGNIPSEYTTDTTNSQTKTQARFHKKSNNPTYTNGNPNYDMSQAKFTVYKDSGKTQAIGTVQCNKTDNYSDWIDLSSHMNATGSTTFYYKETTMPKGCENSVPAEGSFTLSASNPEYTAEVGNTGGADLINLKIDKLDSTGSNNMYGNNTLEGAEFTVKYYPQDINGNLNTSVAVKPEHVWVFQTKKNDADPNNVVYDLRFTKAFLAPSCTNTNYFTNNTLHLPYGFITVQETKAPTGYKTNGDFSIGNVQADANGVLVFKVSSAGESVRTATGTYSAVADDGTILKKDTPIRADLIIKKLDHNGDNMAGVQFEIKCNESQEKVVVVTDDEGKFCTATTYAAHGYKTNSGEAKSGTWFGNQNNIDESLGALYEGTYTITELRCEANKGKQLEKPITISVNASTDASVIPVYDANAADAQEFIYNYPMPEIHTDALVKETGSKSMGQVGAEEDGSQIDYSNQTIVDDMEYKYLRAGTSFVVLAELMVIDPETGNVTPYTEKDASGNDIPYKRIKSFSTDANYDYSRYEKEGHVTIELDGVDPTGLEGKKFVVYETVYLDDTRNPYTKVEDLPDDDNALQYDGYADLVDDQGNNISEMYFFPLRHNDPDDTRQQVYPADLHTTAMGKETGDHVGYVGTETFIDRVFFTGLSVGQQYTINGLVYIKDDAKDIKDATVVTGKDGQPVKATKTFTAEQSEGYVDIEFTIPAEDLMGERIVCVEDVWQDKIRLALHADINDSDEIYYIPEIHTSTRNGKVDKTKITDKNKDSAKEVCASAEGDSFIDTISYSSLISNREFKVVGTLMDKATGEVMKDAKGNVIKAETTFKTKEVGEIKITDSPDAKDYLMADGTVLDMSADHADYLANGSVDLEFKGFDFTTLANKTGVVYEEVYLIKTDAQGNKKEYLVGDHKKLDDIDQFVYFVQIGTQAQDKTTGIQVAPRNTKTKIQDRISFHGCIVGKTYEFTATFRVKNDTSGKYKDGDILLGADGKPVTASAKYTPTTKDGEAVVEIELDTSVLESSEIICFESMKNELGIEIACHNDLEDSSQKIEIPGGKTKATDKDGKKTVKANSKVTVYDKLTFTNLQPAKEYTATGTLMLKETGEALTDANGNKVTNTVKFTPTEKDGYVTIPFEVDTSMLGGKTIVVYEDVYYQDVPLFIEHNINDEDQSITVTPPTTPPKTGMIILFTIIGLMAVGGAGMLIFKRKRA